MNKKITSVIMVVAIVMAAAAISINGYNSVYAESGTRGGAFNNGPSHTRCTAVAAGANCESFTDFGKHKGLE
jgi:hypothetical protein